MWWLCHNRHFVKLDIEIRANQRPITVCQWYKLTVNYTGDQRIYWNILYRIIYEHIIAAGMSYVCSHPSIYLVLNNCRETVSVFSTKVTTTYILYTYIQIDRQTDSQPEKERKYVIHLCLCANQAFMNTDVLSSSN